MKLLSIAKKEIKINIRNISVMLIMTMMPLVMIFVLGIAFSGMMDNDGLSIDNMHIEYTSIGNTSNITGGVESMMKELLADGDNSFIKTQDMDASLTKLGNSDLTAVIEIDERFGTITIYKNQLHNTEASLLQGILDAFVNRYNSILEIIEVNPQAMAMINTSSSTDGNVQSVGLQSKESPSSMDYYGVAMCTLFVLYGMLIPMFSIITEKRLGTYDRTLVSPIERRNVFMGKILGFLGISLIQVGLVVLIGSQVYNVNWGDAPIYPLMLVFTEIIMAVSIGTCIGYTFKKEAGASSMIHIFIVLTSFFGGGYMALEDLGSLSEVGKNFSILWWVNTGIFNQIYLGTTDVLFKAMGLNIIIAVAALMLAVIMMNRKEGMNHA